MVNGEKGGKADFKVHQGLKRLLYFLLCFLLLSPNQKQMREGMSLFYLMPPSHSPNYWETRDMDSTKVLKTATMEEGCLLYSLTGSSSGSFL